MNYRNVAVLCLHCCKENVSNREGGWVTLAKRHNFCPQKWRRMWKENKPRAMGPPVVNCWLFISCPIWRDLVLSILYRPYELGLFPFHTQCLRNPGHQREEPVCQTSPAPDVIFYAFHRYSRCCIQSKVTFLVKQEKVTVKLGRLREVLQKFRITVTENGKCQIQNDNFS